MFYKIKELLDRLDIVHLDEENPSFDDVIKNILCKSDTVDAVSYYITTDVVKQQMFDYGVAMKKYDIDKEKYEASKYSGCEVEYKEPTISYQNAPGMFWYHIITGFSPNATFLSGGKELPKEMFQDVEYIPNFLLHIDNIIEIINPEYTQMKVYSLKFSSVKDELSKYYIEGNIVITNKKMFNIQEQKELLQEQKEFLQEKKELLQEQKELLQEQKELLQELDREKK
jgi:hypothetical protein